LAARSASSRTAGKGLQQRGRVAHVRAIALSQVPNGKRRRQAGQAAGGNGGQQAAGAGGKRRHAERQSAGR